MSSFSWDPLKNEWLIANRGVSFERVVVLIYEGAILDIIQHPNFAKYPRQQIFILNIDDYAHLVPFVETPEQIFLKSIIPSRKATKQYLGGT
jgi:uncharacterized DUF497 family protein